MEKVFDNFVVVVAFVIVGEVLCAHFMVNTLRLGRLLRTQWYVKLQTSLTQLSTHIVLT